MNKRQINRILKIQELVSRIQEDLDKKGQTEGYASKEDKEANSFYRYVTHPLQDYIKNNLQ
jgi:hypothetical protein